MKTLSSNPTSTIKNSSFSLKRILTFAFILFATLHMAAQDIVLKEGLYYTASGTLYSGTYNSYSPQTGNKLASITLVDGKKNGPATYYFQNGNVKEMGMFLNNEKNEQWLDWDEAGNKIAEAFYSNGKKNGTWMIWDTKGTKRYEMYYSMDKKVGKWSMWDENGNLSSQKTYNEI